MARTLNYPSGKALIAAYRERFGDKTLLGFSRGKDSIGAAIALRGELDVYPVYFYSVPGLSFIEEGLEYYSKTLFHGRKIAKFPEAAFLKWVTTGIYQTPGSFEVIKAADIQSFSSGTGHKWWRDVTGWVIDDLGLPETILSATGVRANDSPMRFLNVKQHGVLRPTKRNWLPIWDWTKADLEENIRKSGVSLPIDYFLFGRSFGGGIDPRFMVPIKRHLPEDWKRVLEWFPLAEIAVWKYEKATGAK